MPDCKQFRDGLNHCLFPFFIIRLFEIAQSALFRLLSSCLFFLFRLVRTSIISNQLNSSLPLITSFFELGPVWACIRIRSIGSVAVVTRNHLKFHKFRELTLKHKCFRLFKLRWNWKILQKRKCAMERRAIKKSIWLKNFSVSAQCRMYAGCFYRVLQSNAISHKRTNGVDYSAVREFTRIVYRLKWSINAHCRCTPAGDVNTYTLMCLLSNDAFKSIRILYCTVVSINHHKTEIHVGKMESICLTHLSMRHWLIFNTKQLTAILYINVLFASTEK